MLATTEGAAERRPYITGYELIDGHSGRVLGRYSPAQKNRARNRCDRLDLDYGAVRYRVRTLWSDQ